MAIYSSFRYGSGTKWGASTLTALHWAIQVDWFDTNFGEGINEAARCISCEWERGRDTFLETPTNGIRFPAVGRASITLDNHDRLYDPRNASGEYYGHIAPGHRARIGVRTPYSGTNIIWRFAGRVTDITPSGWRNGYVDLVIEDALQWLYDQDVDIDVQQLIRIDEAIAQILTTAAWPWDSDLAISADSLRYWWATDKASSEIADLTASGIGYFSVLGNGKARYLNRADVTASPISLTDDNTLNNPRVAQPWENYKNSIRVRWYPKQLQASGVIWSDISVPVSIVPGGSYITFGDYAYNGIAGPALSAAVGSADYSVNSASDGSGSDITADFDVSLTDFGASAKLIVTNNGAVTGYVMLLQITGEAITTPYTGSYIDNRLDYATNPRTWTLELPWQQTSGRAEAIAAIMADYLSAERTWPTVTLENRFDTQFGADIFDTLRYTSNYLGIDDSFRVGKIREQWISDNGQAVRTSYTLEPYVPGAVAWTWPVTDFGTDTILG